MADVPYTVTYGKTPNEPNIAAGQIVGAMSHPDATAVQGAANALSAFTSLMQNAPHLVADPAPEPTNASQAAEAMSIEAQIFGSPTSPQIVASPALVNSGSQVGQAPSKRVVTSIAVDSNGNPYSSEQLSAAASRWLGTVTPAGQVTKTTGGVTYTGLAGSVSNPAGLPPVDHSVIDGVTSTNKNGALTRFAPIYYAEGTQSDSKDQSRLAPGQALAFNGNEVSWQNVIIPTEESTPLSLTAQNVPAVPPPQSLRYMTPPQTVKDPITNRVVAAPPAPVPEVRVGTNNYIYQANPTGGWTQVGLVDRSMQQNPTAAHAYASGQSSYTAPGGGLVPTVDVNGNRRTTYGDSAGGLGQSLTVSQF